MLIVMIYLLTIRAAFGVNQRGLSLVTLRSLKSNPACLSQKNPGAASTIIRERIFDGKPLILTGENGKTKKRIKFTNHKGDNHDFQKNEFTRLFFQFTSG
ncbi:MAG: hypothetical protein QG657_4137, partial [Acidobacteriota bacterium]|nr:hypothetical protein [Acidobacteriota bacterium]